MEKLTVRDGDICYRRVSKVTARKAFNDGKQVVFCPCKLYPFGGGWRHSMKIQRNPDIESFDYAVQMFQWCNCNYETGYYVSFYIQEIAK